MTQASDIVARARSYLGTPFAHRGRLPGVGLDCVGVGICVARDEGLKPRDFDVPPYLMVPDGVTLLKHCREHMDQVTQAQMRAGDMIIVRRGHLPQHAGILGDYAAAPGALSIIHSTNEPEYHRVIEQRLMFHNKLRFVAAFRFRGVQKWAS